MTTTVLHPRATVTAAGQTRAANDAAVTLDESWAPYAQGEVVVPFDDPAAVIGIDPRKQPRARIEATSDGAYQATPPVYSDWATQRTNLFKEPIPATATMYPGARSTVTFIADATGNYARATCNAAGSVYFNFIAAQNRVAVLPGQTVTFQFEARAGAGATGRTLRLYWLDAAGAVLSSAPDVTITGDGGAWATLQQTGVAPAGAAFFGAYALMQPAGVVGYTLDVRRVMAEVGAGSTYFDGATPDTDLERFEWTGTVNASTSVDQTRTITTPAGAVWVPGTPRVFDLGIRSRHVDYRASLCTLQLASDEALVQDFATLLQDRAPLDRQTSLRSICDYVIGKATGNALPYGDAVTDTTGWTYGSSGGTGVAATLVRGTASPLATASPWYYNLTLTAGTGTITYFQAYGVAGVNVIPVKPGDRVSIRADLWSNTTKRVSLAAEYFNASGGSLGATLFTHFTPNNKWINVVATPAMVAPAAAVSARVIIRMYADAPVVGDRIGFTGVKASAAADIGAPSSLLGGNALDIDATRYWDATNHVTNPNGATNVDDWALSANAQSLTSVTASPAPPYGTKAVRWAATAAGTTAIYAAGYSTQANKVTGMRVVGGRSYSASAQIYTGSSGRSAAIGIQWRDSSERVLAATYTADVPGAAGFVRIALENLKAPQSAVGAAILVRTTNNAAGGFSYAANVAFNDGATALPFFDGSTPDAAGYFYDWTGTANLSASERTASPFVAEESALIWQPGVTGWDFLEPLLSAYGVRLFCDELRVWRMVRPAFSVGSTVNITPATAVEADDVISRDPDSPWADGVVARYAWDDYVLGTQVRYDVAGNPGKVLVVEYLRPYPGPGAAAAILASVQAQGRTQEVDALVDGRATPGMSSIITIEGGGYLKGRIRTISFDLVAGRMHVTSRDQAAITSGMIDALPGTINALPGQIDNLPGG